MRFTVGKKIGGGFSIVVILLLIVFFYTFSVVNEAIKSNDKFLNVDQPSLFVINQLKDNLSKTHTHMQQWVIDESRPDEHFKVEAKASLMVLFMRTPNNSDELINGLKYWTENIHDLLQAECKKLKEDLPVKNVSDEERYRLTLEQADPPEMNQWQTIRYYLMDLTTPDEQMLLSSEASSLKIDIDLSWINDHREKFLRPWKELLHSVEQKLNEMKDDSNSASI